MDYGTVPVLYYYNYTRYGTAVQYSTAVQYYTRFSTVVWMPDEAGVAMRCLPYTHPCSYPCLCVCLEGDGPCLCLWPATVARPCDLWGSQGFSGRRTFAAGGRGRAREGGRRRRRVEWLTLTGTSSLGIRRGVGSRGGQGRLQEMDPRSPSTL